MEVSFVFLEHVDNLFQLVLALLDAVGGLEYVVTASCEIYCAKVLSQFGSCPCAVISGALSVDQTSNLTIVHHSAVAVICGSC